MRRTSLNDVRGNPANTRTRPGANRAAPVRVREREREAPVLEGCAPAADAPDEPGPIPESLARGLNQLKQRLRGFRPSESRLGELTQLMQDLHQPRTQKQIKRAMRDHAQQKPVPGLCQAFEDFLARLDKAITGKAAPPGRDATRAPERDSLPLSSLNMAHIESLCLGLSTLAIPGVPPPVPVARLPQARASLSALTAKLMAQAQALGGAHALEPGPLMNIGNLPRRLVVAGLIDPKREDQADTRAFCSQSFQAFQQWAERERKLDSAHDVSKCASMVEMMFDHELGGVSDSRPSQVKALEKVLGWLLGRDAIASINAAKNAVALAGQVNLAKRMLENGKFNPGDRSLDPMWARLLAAIRSLGPAAMIGKDGYPLTAFANLARAMMDAELPRQWLAAATHKDASAKDKTAARKMRSNFAAANVHILGAFSDPAFKKVRELQALANLSSYIKAGDKQRQAGWKEEGQWPEKASFAEGAGLLVQALPRAKLAALKGQKLVGGLFAGLGYAWQEGLVAERGHALSSLVELVQALPGTGLWQARYRPAMTSLLASLIGGGHIDEPALIKVLDAVLEAPQRPWTTASFLEYERQKAPLPIPRGEPLKLQQEAPDEEEPEPVRQPLVGETRLVDTQHPAEPPAPTRNTPAAPRLVPLSVRSGKRSNRRGADWDAPMQASLSAALAPQQSTLQSRADEEDPEQPASPGPKKEARSGKATTGKPGATTTTITITTTTATTATTTTTAVSPPATSQPQDPAAIKEDCFRLASRKGIDPSVKLLRMARAHPACLDMVDDEGNDILWHLVLTGKPNSLEALIKQAKWKPQVSEKLEARLTKLVSTFECTRSVSQAISQLQPFMTQAAWTRLQRAVFTTQPPKPATPRGVPQHQAQESRAHTMLTAIKEGWADTLAELLRQNVQSGVPETDLLAALVALVKGGHVDALQVVLAHAGFQQLIGRSAADGKTLLVHAILEGRSQILAPLLKHRSVLDSLFTVCELPLHSKTGPDEQVVKLLAMYGQLVDLPKTRKLDAVMLAVESCRQDLLAPLLALPMVKQKLASDGGWKLGLVSLAEMRGNHWALQQLRN